MALGALGKHLLDVLGRALAEAAECGGAFFRRQVERRWG